MMRLDQWDKIWDNYYSDFNQSELKVEERRHVTSGLENVFSTYSRCRRCDYVYNSQDEMLFDSCLNCDERKINETEADKFRDAPTVQLAIHGVYRPEVSFVGWAFIMIYKEHQLAMLSKNNVAKSDGEMYNLALIAGLLSLKKSCIVELFTYKPSVLCYDDARRAQSFASGSDKTFKRFSTLLNKHKILYTRPCLNDMEVDLRAKTVDFVAYNSRKCKDGEIIVQRS